MFSRIAQEFGCRLSIVKGEFYFTDLIRNVEVCSSVVCDERVRPAQAAARESRRAVDLGELEFVVKRPAESHRSFWERRNRAAEAAARKNSARDRAEIKARRAATRRAAEAAASALRAKKRVQFEEARDSLFELVKAGFLPHRDFWGGVAALCSISDVAGDGWFLSPKERNRIQHALNGNIFPEMFADFKHFFASVGAGLSGDSQLACEEFYKMGKGDKCSLSPQMFVAPVVPMRRRTFVVKSSKKQIARRKRPTVTSPPAPVIDDGTTGQTRWFRKLKKLVKNSPKIQPLDKCVELVVGLGPLIKEAESDDELSDMWIRQKNSLIIALKNNSRAAGGIVRHRLISSLSKCFVEARYWYDSAVLNVVGAIFVHYPVYRTRQGSGIAISDMLRLPPDVIEQLRLGIEAQIVVENKWDPDNIDVPVDDHLDARDSTMSDIELNPGPSLTGVISAGLSLLGSLTFRLGNKILTLTLEDSNLIPGRQVDPALLPDWLSLLDEPRPAKRLKSVQAAVDILADCWETCGHEENGTPLENFVFDDGFFSGKGKFAKLNLFTVLTYAITGSHCLSPLILEKLRVMVANVRAVAVPKAPWVGHLYASLPELARCTDPAHDRHAVLDKLISGPSYLRGTGSTIFSTAECPVGFGHVQCPFCWPGTNYWTAVEMPNDLPFPSMALASPNQWLPHHRNLLTAVLSFAFTIRTMAERISVATGKVLVLAPGASAHGMIVPQLGQDITIIVWDMRGTRPQVPNAIVIDGVQGGADFFYFCLMLACQSSWGADKIVLTKPGLSSYLTPEVFVTRGFNTYYTAAGLDTMVAYGVETFGAVVASKEIPLSLMAARAPEFAGMLYFSSVVANVHVLSVVNLNSTWGIGVASWSNGQTSYPGECILTVSGSSQVVLMKSGQAYRGYFAAALAQVAPIVLGATNIWRVLAGRDDMPHVGRMSEVAVKDVGNFLPSPILCSCFKCGLRAYYGPILIPLFGTTGDRVPYRAIGRQLTTYGLDVIICELQSLEEGISDLRFVERGRTLELAGSHALLSSMVSSSSLITYGSPTLRAMCPVAVVTPPYQVAGYNFKMGPLLDAMLSSLSGLLDTSFYVNVASGICHLPRSADGKKFLQPSTNKKRSGELWAPGSYGGGIPKDVPLAQAGDHFSQFEKVSIVYTHGGAGTTQTAAMAGAKIFAIDNTLDRNVPRVIDAFPYPVVSHSPDKVLLPLLGYDFAIILFAFKINAALGLDALRSYFLLFAARDLGFWWALIATAKVTLSPAGFLPSVVASLIRGISPIWGVASLIILHVWGELLLGRLGLSAADVSRFVLHAGRRTAGYPIVFALWFAGYYQLSMALFMLQDVILPCIAGTIVVSRDPPSYLCFGDAAMTGIPVHVWLQSNRSSLVIEGDESGVPGDWLYCARRTEKARHPIVFKIPTALVLEAVEPVAAVGEYDIFTNNCATVLWFTLGGHRWLSGMAAFMLPVLMIVGIFLGIFGMAILVFGTLLLIGIGVVVDSSGRLHPAIAWILSRTSRIHASIDLHGTVNVIERFSKVGNALLHALGTQGPSVYSEQVREYRKQILEAFQAHDYDKLREISAAADSMLPAYEKAGVVLPASFAATIFSDPSLSKNGLDEVLIENLPFPDLDEFDEEQARFVIAPVDPIPYEVFQELTNFVSWDITADNDLQVFYDSLVPDNVRSFSVSRMAVFVAMVVDIEPRLTKEVFDFVEGFDLIKSTLERYPSWGHGPNFTEIESLVVDYGPHFKAVFSHIFFQFSEISVPIEMVAELGSSSLKSEQIETMSILAAVALSTGATDDEAISLAAAFSRDVLNVEDDPFGDKLIEQTATAVSDASGIVDAIWSSLGGVSLGLHWIRRKLATSSGYKYGLQFFEFGLSFFTTFWSLMLLGLWRIIEILPSLACEAFGMPREWVDVINLVGLSVIAALDPKHRARTKPAWALLIRRARERLSVGEALIFSLAPRSRVKEVADYSEWVEQMAELMSNSGVDVSKLHRTPPERAVYYPKHPVGVEELNDLPLAVDAHFHETEMARTMLEQSLAVGNGLTIDGAWLARPQDVQASLERYTVPRPIVSHEAKMALEEAADALFEQYKELYDAPLPMSVETTARLSKWKYASGLPFLGFIKKRETLRRTKWFDAIINGATRILREGVFPKVGLHGFPKNYVRDVHAILRDRLKLRTVTAGDRVTAIAVNTLLLERNKRVGDTLAAGQLNQQVRSEGGILHLKQFLSELPHSFSGDGAAFDSTVASEVATVGSVRLFKRGFDTHNVWNAQAAVSVVEAYYNGLMRGFVVNLTDGSVVWKTGGGGTGSAATTPDNRDWTRMVFIASYATASGRPASDFFVHFRFTNASDDVFFTTDDHGRSLLPTMLNHMREDYGVRFSIQPEDRMNNILHLIAVAKEDLDVGLYELFGVPVPAFGLRHDPKRLLLQRSAFRADRVRAFDPRLMNLHLSDRSCGYQMLTAHSRDMYDMVTRDLVDANLSYAKLYFQKAEAVLEYGDHGHLRDGYVVIPDNAPARYISNFAEKRERLGRGPAKDYVLSEQRKARIRLRQHRGKSYEDVFKIWVRPPPAVEKRRAGRRWLVHRAAAKMNSPLIDLVRLGIISMADLKSKIPKALVGAFPEKGYLPIGESFLNSDWIVERFIWRKFVLRHAAMPNQPQFEALIRESPFASATDASGFFAWLGSGSNMRKELYACKHNVNIDDGLFPSNYAVSGRVVIFLVIYTFIDVLIRALEATPILGLFVLVLFALYQWLEVFYSLQSLIFWLGTGSASIVISNTVPKDRYRLQKILARVFASAIPGIFTDHFFGIDYILEKLSSIVELQAWVPMLLYRANDEVVRSLTETVPSTWNAVCQEIVDHVALGYPSGLVVAAVGTGKSTSFPATLMRHFPEYAHWLLLPTNALVDAYDDQYLPALAIRKLSKLDQVRAILPGLLNVCTVGLSSSLLNARAIQPRHLIIYIDETHLTTSEQWQVVSAASKLRDFGHVVFVLGMTGTPIGGLCTFLEHEGHRYVVERQMVSTRRALAPQGDLVAGIDLAIRSGIAREDIMVYDPSVTTLERLAFGYSAAGVDIRFITRERVDTRARAMTFGTGVIMTGANVDPPPKALVWAARAYDAVPSVNDYPIEGSSVPCLPLGWLNTYSTLQVRPTNVVEEVQFPGRVGRVTDGLTVRCGPSHVSKWTPLAGMLAVHGMKLKLLRAFLADIKDTSELLIDESLFLGCVVFSNRISAMERTTLQAFILSVLLNITFKNLVRFIQGNGSPLDEEDEMYRGMLSYLDVDSLSIENFTSLPTIYNSLNSHSLVHLRTGRRFGAVPAIYAGRFYLWQVNPGLKDRPVDFMRPRTSELYVNYPHQLVGYDDRQHNPQIVKQFADRLGSPAMLDYTITRLVHDVGLVPCKPFIYTRSCCGRATDSSLSWLVIGSVSYHSLVGIQRPFSDSCVDIMSLEHSVKQAAPYNQDMFLLDPVSSKYPDHFMVSPIQHDESSLFILIEANKCIQNLDLIVRYNGSHAHSYRIRYTGVAPPIWTAKIV